MIRERLIAAPLLGREELAAPGLAGLAVAVAGHFLQKFRPRDRSLLALVAGQEEAADLQSALAALLPGETFLLESWDALPFEPTSLEPDHAARRCEALASLAGAFGRPALVVAAARAAARVTLSPATWSRLAFRIRGLDEIAPARVRERLAAGGFRRVAEVSEAGEFAVRGGIIDLFPPGESTPLRLEWDGDLIASIRPFEIQSQRSTGQREELLILPPRELLLPADEAARLAAADAVRQALKPSLRRDRLAEAIETGSAVEGLELLLPFLAATATVFDFPAGLLLVDEERIAEQLGEIAVEAAREATESDLGFAPEKLWPAALPPAAAARFSTLPREGVPLLAVEPLPSAPLDSALLRLDLKRLTDLGDEVLLVSALAGRVEEILKEEKLADESIVVVRGDLAAGGRFPELRLAFAGDGELFGHRARRRARGRKRRALFWGALTPGEYVAHLFHGIGVFRGIERITSLGETRDVLLIEYAGGDRLYLPPHETTLLERYAAAEGVAVKLDRLGAAGWSKVRQKVERETAEIARELLDLYALRSAAEGARFAAPAHEDEFAAAFTYEETEDQERAIEEILADLGKCESKMPMDRLLCGDVGFGKTEVALRAVFRVAANGRQAAVLCPTTILALQHRETFRERLSPFGLKVGSLSRFASSAETKRTLADLEAGRLRVVVGTHKLLGRNVRFRDLGLVVIDEEQRFGVRHKEYLKNLRKRVDILTMTATPIPRTLHLALSGVRSVSLIETPPAGRSPVQTVVEPFSEERAKIAIRRELDREGQVFYVHNRIETLDRVHGFLRKSFPREKIGMAHGQMPADELEEIVKAFLAGESRILLSTAIVENGLDIPTANTMIVDMAERFGLADLYQLRGRVGRSTTRAYACFFYRADGALTPEARARLAAIAEHTALGAGYAVARRDLEIRGAGEILGAAQSGEMAAVGYDMYCRLLREAVDELRGAKGARRKRPVVDLALSAYLPAEWLGGDELVSEVHREISDAATVAAVDALREGLIDRFGQPPPPVENLLELARLRAYAELDNVESVIETPYGIEVRWRRTPPGLEEHLATLPPPIYTDWRDGALHLEKLPQGRGKLELLRKLLRR